MQPLAERFRPKLLDDYVGQQHIIGPGAILRKMIESGNISSFILWGPPGVGKTSLARIIANQLDIPFFTLSAVTSGVKDVREVIEKARQSQFFTKHSAILFIDEIHRFSKSQQDSLLGAVENGTVTLIGATTENPSFEVITPLLSRCQVYVLKPLDAADLRQIIQRVVNVLKNDYTFQIDEDSELLANSGGDARKLLNILEILINNCEEHNVVINNKIVRTLILQNPLAYDKNGEMHYDIISAFIKSIRGSDAKAATYWLARMIEGGEDPKFIARRLVIAASEDIGLANPNALLMANACFDTVNKVGLPEGRIPLAMATIYLANSKKDNTAYKAIDGMIDVVRKTGNLPVPLHLRNAPTSLMKELNYGAEYKYPHDYPNHWVEQQYLPDELLENQ